MASGLAAAQNCHVPKHSGQKEVPRCHPLVQPVKTCVVPTRRAHPPTGRFPARTKFYDRTTHRCAPVWRKTFRSAYGPLRLDARRNHRNPGVAVPRLAGGHCHSTGTVHDVPSNIIIRRVAYTRVVSRLTESSANHTTITMKTCTRIRSAGVSMASNTNSLSRD